MIAYPDGTEVRVGDAVSLGHGEHRGVVQHVLHSAEETDAWDLDERGVMIDTSYGGLVFYPRHSLTDDEIVLISRATA
jgi:hypothetical protein